ncbi:MAG: hypothetical protein R2822_15580 [Spirosomataceae bacterium]
MSAFQYLTIHFETAAQLPPPYSYQYALTLTPSSSGLTAALKLTYTHRDEIDADEIAAEGFTENDNYAWEGSLEKVWKEEVERLFLKTKLDKKLIRSNDSDFLTVEIQTDQLIQGQPKNKEEWQFLAQELVQAIYETSEKERPFEIQVLDVTSQGVREATLTASFSSRNAQIKRVIDGKSSMRFFAWQDLPSLMEALYGVDWFAENAMAQKPKKNGLYLNPGDGLWYEWGKQILEVGKGSKGLNALKSQIAALLSV